MPQALLDKLLRRLPRVARQLRVLQGDRPGFAIEHDRDLEDLVRALLPLHFDDIRLENRTPSYSLATRTDFLLGPSAGIALTCKRVAAALSEAQLRDQVCEDAAYYEYRPECRTLTVYLYDPEGLLRETERLEGSLGGQASNLRISVVIAG